MAKSLRIILRSLAVLFGLLAAVVVFIALFVNSEFGRTKIASLVNTLTGGRVSIAGLSGRIPDYLRVKHFELSDARGVWLTLDDVALDWNPLPLAWNRFAISRLEAARAHVLRLAIKDNTGPNYVFDIRSLRLPHVETDAPVSGRPAVLSVRGAAVHYAGLMDWAADLNAARLDEPGSYRINGQFMDAAFTGTASIQERPRGLIGGLLGLNDIGPISAEARAMRGNSTNTMSFQLHAGPLSAMGNGAVDITHETADMDFTASAPAMEIRPDLKWAHLSAEGHFHGGFSRPDIAANVDVRALSAFDMRVNQLTAKVQGNTGDVRFAGSAVGLMLPGDQEQIFAKQPVALNGRVNLAAARRPFDVSMTHPLLAVSATGEAAAPIKARLSIEARNLAPFARLEDIDLGGRAKINAELVSSNNAYRIVADGMIDALGESVLAGLIGRNATFHSATAISGTTASISDARFDAEKISARLSGSLRDGSLDLRSSVRLPDVSVLIPRVKGDLDLNVDASGPFETARLSARGRGTLATDGFAPQRLVLTADAAGLPMPQSGKFTVAGQFDDAPVDIDGDFAHPGGMAFLVSLNRAEWKSLRAMASFTFPDAAPAAGQATLSVANLRDLSAFTDSPIAGRLQARIALSDRNNTTNAAIFAQATGFAFGGTNAQTITIRGDVTNPFENVSLDVNAAAEGLRASGFRGKANASLKGALQSLAVRIESEMADGAGNPAQLAGAGTIDWPGKSIALRSFSAMYRDEAVSLIEPARIDLRQGLAVDRLLIGAGGGRLTVVGRFSPALAANITAQNVSAVILAPFLPAWQPAGVLSGSADLSGTLAAPRGTIVLEGRNLRSPAIPAAIGPGSLTVRANLLSDSASVDAQISAGNTVQVNLTGMLPVDAQHEMALRVTGNTDLAVFNGTLSAEGRKLLGRVSLDGSLNGTFAAPRIEGHASLAGGEVQDVPRGFRVHDIVGDAESDGMTVRLTKFSGTAGEGAVTATGSVDLSGDAMPVNIVLTARNARPLVSDRFSGTMDSNLRVTGDAKDQLTVSGDINLTRGEIHLPDTFPPSVVVLDVRRRGEAPPRREAEPKPLRLDLKVTSPGQVFVRGRGIDAEVQGEMRVTGTTDAPQVSGGLDLRRGTFTVAGQTLNFTRGRVTFTGASLQNEINPALDLVAENRSGNIDVQLAVTGVASEPRIQLTSTPSLPQDEILASLLFQQSTAQLSPFQLAEIAQAAISLTDAGRGLDPIAGLRKGLGLDRLAVGSVGGVGTASAETETTVTAGKYVARNIYVGATQGVSGGTQAEVQIDLTRNLKAIGTVNNGLPTNNTQQTRQHEESTSIGLRYQFEY